MLRIASLLALVALAGQPLAAQRGTGCPCCMAAAPVIEVSGTVEQVHIAPGQGPAYLEVKHGSEVSQVWLGPMHYLIAQDFSPKAGQEVAVKGYKQTNGILAVEVTLTKEKQTLKLRDANGCPMWQGGRWGRGRGRGPGW